MAICTYYKNPSNLADAGFHNPGQNYHNFVFDLIIKAESEGETSPLGHSWSGEV